ncbi:MAG: DUF1499 domain-containing protein [Marinomonas sp.]
MIRWIIITVVVLVIGLCIYVGFANKMPKGLGITDGLFKACPSSPNCVSTQAPVDDSTHYAEAIVYSGERKDVQLLIESHMLNQGDAHIVSSSLGYVHFEVKSKIIGYIDDVEFYLPETDKVVHFRSASRVGYSDRGVNRDRMEKIYSLLAN